jgi:hypothetical protein
LSTDRAPGMTGKAKKRPKRLAAPTASRFGLSANYQLPMSAAVSATTVKSTTTATVESTATSVAAGVPTSGIITGVSASIASARVTSGVATSTYEAAAIVAVSVVARPTIVSAVTPSPVVPGTGTDKHSARKPLRTIEAVRRTGIGIVRVIPVRTHRRPVHIARARVGIALVITLVGVGLVVSDRNSCLNLRLRVRNRQHQHSQQRNISQITHMNPLGSSPAENLMGSGDLPKTVALRGLS